MAPENLAVLRSVRVNDLRGMVEEHGYEYLTQIIQQMTNELYWPIDPAIYNIEKMVQQHGYRYIVHMVREMAEELSKNETPNP